MSEENISLPVAQALASALEKIEAYVPTEYVDNSEPDIDAEHLNHAEQGIMRVTNLLNAAVDVIQGQESRLEDTETKIGTAALTGGMTDLSSGVNSLYSNTQNLKKFDFVISVQKGIASINNKNKINDGLYVLKFEEGNKAACIVFAIGYSPVLIAYKNSNLYSNSSCEISGDRTNGITVTVKADQIIGTENFHSACVALV